MRPVLDTLASLAKDTLNSQYTNGMQLEDVSIVYQSAPTCACDNITPAPEGHGCMAALLRKCYAARMWICQFTCSHLRLVMGSMLLQIAILGLWIISLLSRPYGSSRSYRRRSRSSSPVHGQFVVHAADYADPELGEPLLRPHD